MGYNMDLDTELNALPSAWTGHRSFADWLVRELKPTTTVDLGVDYGFSLFALAIPQIGHVYGIDSFEAWGDDTSGGGYHPDNYDMVMRFKTQHCLDNITVIRGYFSDVAKTWNLPIDLLHIDGLHTYNAVKEDWDNWTRFLTGHGVVIMHDVASFDGVKQFYNEIPWPKVYFGHSAGLGVATKNLDLLAKIISRFPYCRRGNM
jgi:hypothetical protein